MGAVDRLVASLVSSNAPLERAALKHAATQMQPKIAPLAAPGDIDAAIDTLVGLGPLEPLVSDDTVSDVLVNSFDDVWIERSGVLEPSDVTFRSPDELIAMVRRLLTPLGPPPKVILCSPWRSIPSCRNRAASPLSGRISSNASISTSITKPGRMMAGSRDPALICRAGRMLWRPFKQRMRVIGPGSSWTTALGAAGSCFADSPSWKSGSNPRHRVTC